MSTRENLTSYKGRITQMDNDDKNSKILNMRQCYVEEQAKIRDSFMIDSYKILKSIINKLTTFLHFL
jgi:hypothetical protein